MNALKILCRSTTLSRNSSKQQPKSARPSSGEAKNPQLFGRQDYPTASQESKKRKRGHSESPPALQDPSLDFFHDRADETNDIADGGAGGQTRHGAKVTSPTAQEEEHVDSSSVEDLPEDECRRILKSHKLKITTIWPVQAEQTTASDSKRKRKKDGSNEPENSKGNKKKRKLDIIPQPLLSFAQLRARYGVDPQLATNIQEQGYTIPTEVQLGALPLLLGSTKDTLPVGSRGTAVQGPDVDLLAIAPTGSGKTLAFLIPILDNITKRKQQSTLSKQSKAIQAPSAVVVAPTKELAAQITNEARKLAVNTGIHISRVRKGMKLEADDDARLRKSLTDGIESSSEDEFGDFSDKGDTPKSKSHLGPADVLVTTPLTLIKAIETEKAGLKPLAAVRHLILDEADVLLDSMFRSQTLKIWSACTNTDLRVSLWSATMGSSVEDIATTTILDRRKKINFSKSSQIIRLVVGLKDSAIPSIQHKLIYAATEAGKLLAMRQLLRPSGNSTATTPRIHPPFLVFTQTIPRAIALASELRYDIPAQAATGANTSRLAVLHADLSDSARASIMARFRAAEIWVLITTDLLSRGVDFRGVNAVVNYDLPGSSAAYVHRVGRTGRAGREGGVAVTLYAEEDVPVLKNVVNVVQAAERAGRAIGVGSSSTTGNGDSDGTQDWLFKALPKLNKREKQRLRKRGVEARREVPDAKRAVGKLLPRARTRISTKSGYERRLENRRKAAAINTAARERQRDSGDG